MKKFSLLMAVSLFFVFSQCSSTPNVNMVGKWKVDSISVGGKKTNAPEELIIEVKKNEITAPVFGASGSPAKETITRKYTWLGDIVKLEGMPAMVFQIKKNGDKLTLSSGTIPLPIITECTKVEE